MGQNSYLAADLSGEWLLAGETGPSNNFVGASEHQRASQRRATVRVLPSTTLMLLRRLQSAVVPLVRTRWKRLLGWHAAHCRCGRPPRRITLGQP